MTFILKKPISHIQLDNSDMWEYFDFVENRYHISLDTIMFLQIIKNAKFADTTLWSENEIHNKILLNNRHEFIKPKKGIEKLGITGKKECRIYRKIINEFNSLNIYDRNIYYYSRPIFNDTKSFAIIQRDNAHSGLGGGGGIYLYKFTNNSWRKIASVELWQY